MGTDATHVSIARCDPAVDILALALAMGAWPDSERAAYQRTIAGLLNTGQANQIVLLAARKENQLIAAQLAQSLPGRAAVVWQPQFDASRDLGRTETSAALFRRLTVELANAGAQLAQALVQIRDRAAGEQFSIGGFSHAADLLYLAANLNEIGDEPSSIPLEFEPFDAGKEQRLTALIDRTYVGTLDCPQLDGMRETTDVITGYRAVGAFRPELWLIVRHRAEDVGCLLMNLHPDVRHAEIVYVALVPEVRGRGWGSELVKKAVELANGVSAERIVLAVDAANQPAIRMYERRGFFEFDRRAVWVRSLTENSK